MKTTRAVMIAALLSAACMQARAVPIVFEFTGTVSGRNTQLFGGGMAYDDSLNGTPFSASLTIETDLLLAKPVYNDGGFAMVQEFTEPEFGAPAVLGSLVLGGEVIDMRPYSRNVGNVAFGDSLGPLGECLPVCFDGVGDSFWINANSRAPEPVFPAEGVMGSGRVLSFGAYELWDIFDPSASGGLFSLGTLLLEDLVSLPLPNATLLYSDIYWTCQTTFCIQVPATTTSLSIDTVTRRIASVPEPATLGLLALGLMGVAGAGRRRARPAQ